RQAHAIRVGLSRRIAEFRRELAEGEPARAAQAGASKHPVKVGAPKRSTPPVAIGRETELSLQEEFLKRKLAPPATFEAVISFIRQTGDAVVRADGGYRVNESTLLTPSQLVDRANRKRRERNLPSFALEAMNTTET